MRGISNGSKVLLIITDKKDEVFECITTFMHGGATILSGEALAGKERKVNKINHEF
ncbi:hypothetical protein ACJDU8_13750 [Clostridium sp. WILCCON 0269]|uniref:Uncharacterized protein n=1 Tax=Candidatus Clostridium eludens TaxID=3381663 RepID=A0ABW8SKP6_9CLOT